MRHEIRFKVISAVMGAILSVASTTHAGWFDFFGVGADNDQPPQSLILGEKGAKLESVPMPPPVVTQPSTKPMPYYSEPPDSVSPPPPTSSLPLKQPGLVVDPDSPGASSLCTSPYGATPCCAPLWSFRAGALFLHRSHAAADPILNYGPGLNPIGGNVLGPGMATGYDLGLTRQLGECYDIDFRFFGLNGWNGATTFPAAAVSTTALGYPFASASSPVALNYGSNLFSNEVNLRRWFSDSWAITGGARWFESGENFVGSFPGTGTFATVNTGNHLYGGQMGLLWRHNFERWSLQANGNVGIYDNFATAFVSSPLNADSALYKRDRVAYASDLAFIGSYRVTNHIALRAGYQMLWINSVALAPNQVNTLNLPTKTGTLDFGHTFYHGALVGFDITW